MPEKQAVINVFGVVLVCCNPNPKYRSKSPFMWACLASITDVLPEVRRISPRFHFIPCKCKYHANTMQESYAATSAICKYICRSQFLHAFTYASPDWCICKSHASVSSLNTSRAQICSGAPGRIAGDSKNMCANPGSNPGRITGIRKKIEKMCANPGSNPAVDH